MSLFVPIQQLVKLPLLGNDDVLQRGKGRLLTWAPYVWEDMQLSVVKIAVRERFQINKRTNTVDLPCNSLQFSSVDVMDHHGVLWPVYRNDRLHDDIVDVSAKKDCACEFQCGHQLCNLIKGYVGIQTTVTETLPDNSTQTFKLVNRRAVDANGFLYEENQFTERVYTNGVWTGVQVVTENKKLCQCEVDKNGCLCDTEENINNVCHHCGINVNHQIPVGGDANSFCNDPSVNTWKYFCSSKMDWFGVQCGGFRHFREGCHNIYNISEDCKRLIFPHNFGFDHVIVRYYADPTIKNMQIPFTVVPTFVTGLKWFDCRWNDKKQPLEQKYGADYARQKWGLFLELNKYRIAELRMILSPPKYIPSYIDHREDYRRGFRY